MSPAIIYIKRKDNSIIIPIFNDLIFNTLIPAIIIHTAKKSFIIHIPLVIQYKNTDITPIKNDTTSNILIFQNILSFKSEFLTNHNIYDIHIVTPIIPIRLPNIFKQIEIISSIKYAATEPKMNNKFRKIINFRFKLIPNPS